MVHKAEKQHAARQSPPGVGWFATLIFQAVPRRTRRRRSAPELSGSKEAQPVSRTSTAARKRRRIFLSTMREKPVRKIAADDHGWEEDLWNKTPGERIEMVEQLTRDAYAFLPGGPRAYRTEATETCYPPSPSKALGMSNTPGEPGGARVHSEVLKGYRHRLFVTRKKYGKTPAVSP